MSVEKPLLTIFGCGYVGSALAREALARGWRVRALTRNPATAAALREAGIAVRIADIADRRWHRHWTDRGDYVVNCVSASSRDPDGYYHSYHGGSKSVIAWLSGASSPVQLVYTSSTSVYPQVDGRTVCEEDAGEPDDLTPTGAVLREAEELYREPLAGVARAFVLRLAGIYGPGRHYLLDQLRGGQNEFPGSGEFLLNLIHRDDAVRAVMAALTSGSQTMQRVFNIADGNPAIKRELVAWVAAELGVAPPRWDPGQLTARQKNRTGGSGLLPNRRIDCRRAEHELGWTPQYPDFRKAYRVWCAGRSPA